MLHLLIGPWIKGANDALLNTPSFAVCLEVFLKLGSLISVRTAVGMPYLQTIFSCRNFAAFGEFSWIGLASTHLLKHTNGYNDRIQPIPGHQA